MLLRITNQARIMQGQLLWHNCAAPSFVSKSRNFILGNWSEESIYGPRKLTIALKNNICLMYKFVI